MKTLNFLRYCVKAKLSHSLAQKTLHKQKKNSNLLSSRAELLHKREQREKPFHFAESRKESHCKTRLVTGLPLS